MILHDDISTKHHVIPVQQSGHYLDVALNQLIQLPGLRCHRSCDYLVHGNFCIVLLLVLLYSDQHLCIKHFNGLPREIIQELNVALTMTYVGVKGIFFFLFHLV